MCILAQPELCVCNKAAIGKKIWGHNPFNVGRGGVNRGVTYWQDKNDKRILFAADDHLFTLNALTGILIDKFGDSRKESLNVGMRGVRDKISMVPLRKLAAKIYWYCEPKLLNCMG